MDRAEVVIIGGGVIGASVAWHLASRGCRDVVVIERALDHGAGSTARATGGFRVQFGTEVNVRLSMLSRDKLLRFEDEIGVDPGYRQYGYLFLLRSQSEVVELAAAQRVQHACGATASRMIDAAEAKRLSPAIDDPAVIGASFCPIDGFIKPTEILRGYAEAAARLGVRFRFEEEFHGFMTAGSRIDSVETSHGLIGARVFVNAAGAWAGEVSEVPVTPLRRRVAVTVPTNVLPEQTPMTIWAGDAFHVRVRDGRVMLVWPDTPPNDDVWLSNVRRMADTRIPVVRNIPIDEAASWWGFYEMSPDRHAIVGRDMKLENLYLANGSSGHGVMHSPAIGQLVAELITGGSPSLDIHALRPSRFAEGQPNEGPALL